MNSPASPELYRSRSPNWLLTPRTDRVAASSAWGNDFASLVLRSPSSSRRLDATADEQQTVGKGCRIKKTSRMWLDRGFRCLT